MHMAFRYELLRLNRYSPIHLYCQMHGRHKINGKLEHTDHNGNPKWTCKPYVFRLQLYIETARGRSRDDVCELLLS